MERPQDVFHSDAAKTGEFAGTRGGGYVPIRRGHCSGDRCANEQHGRAGAQDAIRDQSEHGSDEIPNLRRTDSDRFNDDRLVARLTQLFGALALILATIGLYGVTAYTVARRTSEIGIRMALGAQPGGVIAMVMRGALSQTVIGLALGIPAAFLCARWVESQLFDIKGVNIGVMSTAIAALAIASLLAGMIPARKAAATDPAQTLRTE